MAPRAVKPPHEDECTRYRKAWRERYGRLTQNVCCCERIRQEAAA